MEQVTISVGRVDVAIIVAYIIGIVVAGSVAHRLAARNIDAYFLGGRRLPWWMLGISGTASYFDVTGVMWLIGLFYVMGARYMWLQWEWGFVATACFAAFMGKWLRRSRVMTGAEWMRIRFGDGTAGQVARLGYAVLAVAIATAFIAFATVGVGKFAHTFFPSLGERQCALIVIGTTSIYVILGGMYSVVVTDLIQFVLICFASVYLTGLALSGSTAEAVASATPADWSGFVPAWHWGRLEGHPAYGAYAMFGLCCLMWVVKGLLLSFGGPQQLYDMQRFLAARDARAASKAGMLWGVCLVPMFLVSAAVGVIGLTQFGAVSDPERLYPVVVGSMLPVGIKGLVLAGLLAAFMSTFDSTVNGGAAYLVRDIYQRYLAPSASERRLVRASYICSALLVAAGVGVGFTTRNIDVIFGWIMMALGTSVLVPNVLRWFWWRLNGWGYAAGTLAGVAAALLQAILWPDARLYVAFPVLLGISVASCVAFTFATRPTAMGTLAEFYRRVRPPGSWAPVARAVAEADPTFQRDSFLLDLASACIGMVAFHSLYMATSYLLMRRYADVGGSLALAAVGGVALYFTWYKHLPQSE